MAQREISRRDFLKGTTAGAVGLLGFGALGTMMGCSSSEDTPAESGTTAATAAREPESTAALASETAAASENQVLDWSDAADIIIIGGGGAGFCAAIEAGRAGSSVIILEKGAFCGGDTALSEGMIQAAGTEEQKTLENWDNDTPQKFADQQVAYAQGFANEDMIREMCMDSPDHIRFMKELGRVYTYCDIIPPAWEFDTEDSWGPRCHWNREDSSGHFTALEDAVKNMDNVRVFTEKPAEHLITDKSEGVIGVTTADGCHYRANKAVILASGSFGVNQEMARKYNRLLYWTQTISEKMGTTPFATPNCTGDGIRMAMEVGAGLALCDSTVTSNMIETGGVGSDRSNIALGIDYHNPYKSSAIPGRILVNKKGCRFVQEDALWGYVNKVCYQESIRTNWPPETDDIGIWFIQDSKWAEYDGAVVGTKLSNSHLTAYFKTADTLDELAELIGVPAENLKATVEKWNEFCRTGKDTEFGRRADMETIEVGPFNAYPLSPVNSGSFGGVDTDMDTRVLDTAGNPIPRLYAAGTIMSGTWCGQFYSSCGWAILGTVHWGRKSGVNAAKLEPWTTEKVTVRETEAPVKAVAAGNYTPGTYQAVKEGYHGEVPVTVIFSETEILSVEVGENGEPPGIGGAAIENLTGKIVAQQSADLDGVSGATFTSQAVLEAVKDCIAQASK